MLSTTQGGDMKRGKSGWMFVLGLIGSGAFGLAGVHGQTINNVCLLYTSPSPRDAHESRMPSSA